MYFFDFFLQFLDVRKLKFRKSTLMLFIFAIRQYRVTKKKPRDRGIIYAPIRSSYDFLNPCSQFINVTGADHLEVNAIFCADLRAPQLNFRYFYSLNNNINDFGVSRQNTKRTKNDRNLEIFPVKLFVFPFSQRKIGILKIFSSNYFHFSIFPQKEQNLEIFSPKLFPLFHIHKKRSKFRDFFLPNYSHVSTFHFIIIFSAISSVDSNFKFITN